MSAPDEVYVLMKEDESMATSSKPLVAHTTLQGAAMEMVSYPSIQQRLLTVECVRLVDDDGD